MCIFLFSPGNELQIDYALENIRLLKRGSVHVVLDLLITNKSNQSIQSIDVLFPHALTRIIDKDDQTGPQVITNGYFRDITDTFFEDNSLHNKSLYQSGSEIKWEGKDQLGESKLKILIPNPNNPVEDIDYYGQIKGKSKLELHDGLSIIENSILIDLEIAYLKCQFDIELKKNEARWFRWEFIPERASKDHFSFLKYWFNYLAYKLNYRYEVTGPIDIMERFNKKLGCFYKECTKGKKQSVREMAFKVQSLQEKIETNGFKLENTQTHFEDWRISLFPADYQELINLNVHGDILTCGVTPNYIDYFENPVVDKKNDKLIKGEHCYQYKGGKQNGCEGNGGKFTISFIAVYVSFFRNILNFLSFILAIIALILSLFLR